MWLCCECGLCIGLRLGLGWGGLLLGGLEGPFKWVRWVVGELLDDEFRLTETYSLTWMPRMVKAVEW